MLEYTNHATASEGMYLYFSLMFDVYMHQLQPLLLNSKYHINS